MKEYLNITNECNLELMKRYKDNHFDLAIVDPPYGIERFKKCSSKDVEGATTSKSRRIAERFSNIESANNIKPSKEYWDELFRVSKNQIVFGANNFEMPPSEYFLCWDKQQAMPNFATLEYAWVSMGLKKPAKLFTYSIHKHNQVNKIHPTQKPVPLYQWILTEYAKEGWKILDTHLGSGGIAIALDSVNKFEKMKLTLTACELNKQHFEDAIKRIESETRQESLF